MPGMTRYADAYPNPFNPATVIYFRVPSAGWTTLKVYDVRGAEVATLVDQRLEAGSFEATFDATDLPSGTYFYQLTGPGFSETNKVSLIK
jgi:hypothetical protein